ncbi:MAG: rRNA maturation RNase YbeY [Legionella sp.]
MNYHIDIQHACAETIVVSDEILKQWIINVLQSHLPMGEMTLRFVSENDIAELNNTYRKVNKPTNVLAFPAKIPPTVQLELPLLGDLIVCPKVLEHESIQLNISLIAHSAHIIIHGVLHLLGYDHLTEDESVEMQAQEIKQLMQYGFENPYKNHAEECKID